MQLFRRSALLFAPAFAIFSIFAPSAQASIDVSIAANVLNIVDSSGVSNEFVLVINGSNARVYDTKNSITAGSGCSQLNAKMVDCPLAGFTSLNASLANGHDYLDASDIDVPMVIDGGNGNDDFLSSAQIDTLVGGAGDDGMDSGAGDDSVQGGSGNDLAQRSDNANLSANATQILDGAEIDTLTDIEFVTLVGGVSANILNASAFPSTAFLYGGKGGDRLIGSNFPDYFEGQAGNDTIFGNNGSDYMLAGPGNDGMFGGNGIDYLNGGIGTDRFVGGQNNDVLIAVDNHRDGRIWCGKGRRDIARLDRSDPAAKGCETVRRRTRSTTMKPRSVPEFNKTFLPPF